MPDRSIRFSSRRKLLLFVGLPAALLTAALAIVLSMDRGRLPDGLIPPEGSYDVRILRDRWGVPHIFGETDADVAYGLAWAHAEDDFPTIQGALLATRGKLAAALGRGAAPNDYMVALVRLQRVVSEGYPRLPADIRAVCEAYAAGLNHYAALHPDEAMPGLYPAQGRDVVAGFVHKLPLFFGLDRVLQDLFAEPHDEVDDQSEVAQRRAGRRIAELGPRPPFFDPAAGALGPVRGSNAIAVAPSRTADGSTYLLINSHQPWTGPVAWYEAHLHSGEGWDMVGGVFPGAPVILHGHNRHLGWAHTVNHPDLIDVYRLHTHPEHPDRYLVDGVWHELEKDVARIEVKIFGPLTWTVEREVLWSIFGPTVRRPHGTFAIRFAGFGETRQLEQWFRMNKAQNADEWWQAMEMGAIPMFHTVYADSAGHISYLYNAALPLRTPELSAEGTLDGTDARGLWTETLPFDQLPRVSNPPVGFVQNCNNTPFRTTGTDADPRPEGMPAGARAAIENRLTNRGLRAVELLAADASITFDELLAVKWDTTYTDAAPLVRHVERAGALAAQDPELTEAAQVLSRWDRRVEADDLQTALVVHAFGRFWQAEAEPGDAELLEALRQAATLLERHFGTLEVPWGNVNRLRRGSVDLAVEGAPDVLHAVYGEPRDDGKLVGVAGDSYVLVAAWDAAGQVRSHSLHQFGSATLDTESPHYADQAPLFARRELKPVWLDESEIRNHLEREYRPGQR